MDITTIPAKLRVRIPPKSVIPNLQAAEGMLACYLGSANVSESLPEPDVYFNSAA